MLRRVGGGHLAGHLAGSAGPATRLAAACCPTCCTEAQEAELASAARDGLLEFDIIIDPNGRFQRSKRSVVERLGWRQGWPRHRRGRGGEQQSQSQRRAGATLKLTPEAAAALRRANRVDAELVELAHALIDEAVT